MSSFDHTTQTGHLAGTAVSWASLTSSRSGAVRYVNNDAEFTTALSAAGSGDIIYLRNGTYSGNWTISQSNLLITAQNPGTYNARNVTKNAGRITINGANVIIGGFYLTWTTSPASNTFVINGANCEIIDLDIKNITYSNATARCVVFAAGADNGNFHHNYVENVSSVVLSVDPDTPGNVICTNVRFRWNTFKNIPFAASGNVFRIGQFVVGSEDDYDANTGTIVSYNKFDNTISSEIKTSRNEVSYNWFLNCQRPFNMRHGEYNVFRNNVVEATGLLRVFGRNHSIINNVFINATTWAVELAEGSLYSQFGTNANAHHIRCENILIANNTFLGSVTGAIHLGYPQTGLLGVGHYEPYSPFNVSIYNNAIRQSTGIGIYLQTPNTAPNSADGYSINVDTYHKYVGLSVLNNKMELTGTAKSGATPSEGGTPSDYIAWNNAQLSEGSNVQSNTYQALNFTGTFRVSSAYVGLDGGAHYNINNVNSLSSVDFDDNPRLSGSALDIGAVEHQFTTVSTSLRFSDTFTDATGTAITSHTPDNDEFSGGWKTPSAGPTIQGNALAFAAPSQLCYADVGGADQIISVTFNAGGSDNRVGIRARYDYGFVTYYQLSIRPGANQFVVQKTVSGTITDLVTTSYTFNLSSTYTIEFSVIRSTIRVLIDTVEVASISDQSIITGRQFAIAHFQFVNANARFDSLSVSTLNYVNGSCFLNQRGDINVNADRYVTAVCAIKQNVQLTGSGTIAPRYIDAAATINQYVNFPSPGSYVDAVATLTTRAQMIAGDELGPLWRKKNNPTTIWRKRQ